MTKCCSAKTDTHRRWTARVRVLACVLPWLAAAPGLVQAQALADAPRVPFSLSAVNAEGEAVQDSTGETPGLGLFWHPRSGLGVRGAFRGALPVATPYHEPGCLDGSGVFGCSFAGMPVAGAGGVGGREAMVGGQWQPLDGLRVGVDLHSRQSGTPQPGALLLPRVLDFIAPGWEDSLSRGVQDGEGVDLNVAYGFDAGVIGELELQVELSHVLNQNLERFTRDSQSRLGLVGQPKNQASVGFNWSRGDFSGSVSSHYTDGIMLDGRIHPAAWTTVDINFAWRTPWNASLSLGAQNFLGKERTGSELGLDAATPPELDSAYSRVPYVRYEQDL